MAKLRFLIDEEEEKEKFGWAQRMRGIGELPKYEFGKMGLEKAKEIEIPESTKLKFTADIGLGVGAKAKAGVSFAKPEEEPETLLERIGIKPPTKPEELKMGIEVTLGTWEEQKRANPELQKMEDFAYEIFKIPDKNERIATIQEALTGTPKEETIKDMQSNLAKYGSINPPKDWKKAFKEEGILKTALIGPSDKYGKAESVLRGFEDIIIKKESPGADLLSSIGWKGMVLLMGSQVVAGLIDITPEIWRKLTIKVADKKISFKEGLEAIRKIGEPAAYGEGTPYQRQIFDEAVKQADIQNISIVETLKKGITLTDITPRFAFGTKLYAGLPADEIAKSIIEVGKVTAEMVKGLDPIKVSQVTQQLLNTSPALASEFLKAVEKPPEMPKAEKEETISGLSKTDENLLKKIDQGQTVDLKAESEAGANLNTIAKLLKRNTDKIINLKVNSLKADIEGKAEAGLFGAKAIAKWIEDFKRSFGKNPTEAQLKEIAIEQLTEGYQEAGGKVAPDDRFIKLDTALKQILEAKKPEDRTMDMFAPKEAVKEAVEPEVPRAEAKAPWEMTKKEYTGDTIWIESAKNEHIQSVITALREGKPVPAEVLADYPDLKTTPKAPAIPTELEVGDKVKFTHLFADIPKGTEAEVTKVTIPEKGQPIISLYIGKNQAGQKITRKYIPLDVLEKIKIQPKPPVTPELPKEEPLTKVPTTIAEAKEILKVDPKKPSVPKDMLAKKMVEKKVSIEDIEAVKGEKIDVKKPKDIIIALRDINAIKKEVIKEPIPKAIPKAVEPTEKVEEVLKKVEEPVVKEVIPKAEPKKEDFEALETTDKNKELFYEKYNQVYTETKKGYEKLISDRVTELKEEGGKGVTPRYPIKDDRGYIIEWRGGTSNNYKWYRDFYERNKKAPTNEDRREIAIQQLSEGYEEDFGAGGEQPIQIPANQIFTKLEAQLDNYEAILSDIKDGDYSFETPKNIEKLNDKLKVLAKENEKIKAEYETRLGKQITESKKRYDYLKEELSRQKKVSTKEDIRKIKDLEVEKMKTEKNIEKLKVRLKEAKIPTPRPERIKARIREITGQIPDKIEIAERDILRLVLRGEARGARRAFSEGKKEGIFGAKENFNEVVARAKERKYKRDEIGKVKDILKKTKLRELRPERQTAIKKIIDEIDLAKMTEKTQRKLTSRLDFIKDDPENQIPPEKIADLERLNKKPISDFTAEDIALVKDSILHEINLNKLKNKIIFGKEIKEAAGELKEARANVLEGKDIKKDDSIIDSGEVEHKSLWQRIGRIWGINSLNPEVICEELDNKDHGVIMKYVFKGLDNGITDKLSVMQEADVWLSNELEGIDVSKWSKAFQGNRKDIDFQEIKLDDGRTLKITKGERISFLLHEKNNKNLAHLIEGGFRFSDNLSRKYKMTEENLDEIINSATKEEIKVADTLWKFFNEYIKPKLNETSMELNGWEIATEDNYFPIRTVALDRMRDALKARKTFDNKTLEGMGIFKERTNAKNALIIEDAFTVATKHLEQISSYIGLAKPLRYAKLILEDTEFQENVMRVKGYGKDYLDNLKRYLQEIEDDSVNLDNVDKLAVELINKLDSAILGMHLFVAFKQPVSYICASTEIDTKYLAKAVIKKNDYDEIREHSPQLFQRLKGHITIELGELGNVGKVRQLFLHKSPLNSKILYLIKAFDSFTIGKIWSAAKVEMKEKYPDISQEEFFEKVTERTEEIVRRTQPTWHTKDRSEIGRSKSVAIRLLTKYTSQRNKNRIILKRATLNYNRSKRGARDKINLIKKYSIVLIVNALLINAIDELRRKAYGKKSRNIWQQIVGAIGTTLSNFYFVGDAFNSLASKIQKGTYAGYDTGNIVSSYVDTAIDGVTELSNTIEQLYNKERYKSGSRKGDLKWKTTALRALDRNAQTLLALKGLPYSNVKNLISGIWKMAGEKEEKKPLPLKITIPESKKLKFIKPELKIKSTKLKFTF